MAGNNLETKWGKIARTFSRNYNIEVRLSGTRCDTDMTGVINIPANSDDYTDADAQVLEGLLDHEWKHVKVQRDAEEQGIKTPKELMRVGSNKTNQLFNVYEDYRGERELAGEYVGCADNLRVANDYVIKISRKNASALDCNPFKAVGLGILGRLMGIDIGWLPAEAQKITEMLKPMWSKAEKMNSHLDAYKLAEQTLEAMGNLKDEMEQPQEQQRNEGQNAESQNGEKQNDGEDTQGQGTDDQGGDIDTDEEGNSGVGNDVGDDDGQDGNGASESDDGQDDSGVKDFLDRLKDQPDHTVDDDLVNTTKDNLEDKSKEFMKKNKRHIAHPDVEKHDKFEIASSHSADSYSTQLKSVKKTVGALRTKLITVIKARSQKGFITERESGNIDTASLYRLRTGDKRVFFEPHKKMDMNTAVSVLVDHSSSMFGTKQFVAQKSAIALAETLNHLGASVEVLGFTTGDHSVNYRHSKDISHYNRFKSVRMIVYKTFNEAFHSVKTRMANMECTGTTPINTGVWKAAERLAVQSEARKILIVLSDGRPELSGSDGDIMNSDLVKKVKQIEAAGIEVVAIGIEDDNVKNFFKDYTIIRDAEQLPKELFKILKRKLI